MPSWVTSNRKSPQVVLSLKSFTKYMSGSHTWSTMFPNSFIFWIPREGPYARRVSIQCWRKNITTVTSCIQNENNNGMDHVRLISENGFSEYVITKKRVVSNQSFWCVCMHCGLHFKNSNLGHFGAGEAWARGESLATRQHLSRDALTMSISLIGTIDNTCMEMLTLHRDPENTRKICNEFKRRLTAVSSSLSSLNISTTTPCHMILNNDGIIQMCWKLLLVTLKDFKTTSYKYFIYTKLLLTSVRDTRGISPSFICPLTTTKPGRGHYSLMWAL